MGIGDVGDIKALALYRRVKDTISTEEQVPTWIPQLINALKQMPSEACSVLKRPSTEDIDEDWI